MVRISERPSEVEDRAIPAIGRATCSWERAASLRRGRSSSDRIGTWCWCPCLTDGRRRTCGQRSRDNSLACRRNCVARSRGTRARRWPITGLGRSPPKYSVVLLHPLGEAAHHLTGHYPEAIRGWCQAETPELLGWGTLSTPRGLKNSIHQQVVRGFRVLPRIAFRLPEALRYAPVSTRLPATPRLQTTAAWPR